MAFQLDHLITVNYAGQSFILQETTDPEEYTINSIDRDTDVQTYILELTDPNSNVYTMPLTSTQWANMLVGIEIGIDEIPLFDQDRLIDGIWENKLTITETSTGPSVEYSNTENTGFYDEVTEGVHKATTEFDFDKLPNYRDYSWDILTKKWMLLDSLKASTNVGLLDKFTENLTALQILLNLD